MKCKQNDVDRIKIEKSYVKIYLLDQTTGDGQVIPPIPADMRSRTIMQPWPDASLG